MSKDIQDLLEELKSKAPQDLLELVNSIDEKFKNFIKTPEIANLNVGGTYHPKISKILLDQCPALSQHCSNPSNKLNGSIFIDRDPK